MWHWGPSAHLECGGGVVLHVWPRKLCFSRRGQTTHQTCTRATVHPAKTYSTHMWKTVTGYLHFVFRVGFQRHAAFVSQSAKWMATEINHRTWNASFKSDLAIEGKWSRPRCSSTRLKLTKQIWKWKRGAIAIGLLRNCSSMQDPTTHDSHCEAPTYCIVLYHFTNGSHRSTVARFGRPEVNFQCEVILSKSYVSELTWPMPAPLNGVLYDALVCRGCGLKHTVVVSGIASKSDLSPKSSSLLRCDAILPVTHAT